MSEISCPEYRGSLLCLNSVAVSLGILITYFLNIYFEWRTIGFLFSALSVMTLLILMKLPESPNWIIALSQKRRHSEALLSLEWIYRKRHVRQTNFLSPSTQNSSSLYFILLSKRGKLAKRCYQVKMVLNLWGWSSYWIGQFRRVILSKRSLCHVKLQVCGRSKVKRGCQTRGVVN